MSVSRALAKGRRLPLVAPSGGEPGKLQVAGALRSSPQPGVNRDSQRRWEDHSCAKHWARAHDDRTLRLLSTGPF